ncbi:hypothetical protein ABZU32_20630 [Sphaerisporangium sp. NPDC005288]|uniref:hypothetical protein n=1 Tax=Sphaerisporangium sp. NPDC005288 TaxID=3155114 RepID=UPI0033A2C061
MADMRDEREQGLYDYPRGEDEYKARVSSLVERRKHLASLPMRPAGIEWQGTGETLATSAVSCSPRL